MTMKFPFSEGTLGKEVEAKQGMSVDYLTCKRTTLDVAELVKWYGAGSALLALGSSQNHLLPRVPRRRP
ncbi:hypothetical protein EOD23_23835 [Mesorhizobium sp. USDA-HM6]|nr:hypothetical protein EOD23_23835 [Mesorhizobium sp. USDA-HM6]